MPAFVPSGYFSIRGALNHLGRELFRSAWTGEEHKARPGLISEDEWLRIKDLPPARGSDAPGTPRVARTAPAPKLVPQLTADPSDPLYQEEYRARKRLMDTRHRLRQMLEAGQLEAAILDPWSGKLYRASASLWRRYGADRMIERGKAPIPGSRNTGPILVKRFAEVNVRTGPMPQAKIKEAIEVLKERVATESLTRSQQADFLRQTFRSYHVTERQLTEIFRAVPVPTGRPRKSGN
jgi:hypothetical protein